MSEILKRASEFQKHFSENSTNILGDLTFASTFTLASTLVPQPLKKFQTAYPSVKIHLYPNGDSEEIKKMIKNNIVDFGLLPSYSELDLSGFEKLTIHEIKPALYVSQKIKKEEEKNLKFILPETEHSLLFEQLYYQKYGRPPEVLLRLVSPLIIASLVKEGLGIGLLADYPSFKQDPLLRRCPPNIRLPTRSLYAIFLSDTKLRKSSEIFLSYLSLSKISP